MGTQQLADISPCPAPASEITRPPSNAGHFSGSMQSIEAGRAWRDSRRWRDGDGRIGRLMMIFAYPSKAVHPSVHPRPRRSSLKAANIGVCRPT